MAASFALVSKTPGIFAGNALLGAGRQLLGRARTCEIVITDDTISRTHAEFFVVGERVQLRDCDSRNGTFVNDKRITVCEIQVGDQLRFGRVAFVVTAGSACPDDVADDDGSTSPWEPPKATGDLQATAEILSAAEWRICELLVDGLPDKQIAAKLKLSRHTVHNHVRAIYRQLGVHSRPELLAKLLRKK